jgi:hypothetical protein
MHRQAGRNRQAGGPAVRNASVRGTLTVVARRGQAALRRQASIVTSRVPSDINDLSAQLEPWNRRGPIVAGVRSQCTAFLMCS